VDVYGDWIDACLEANKKAQQSRSRDAPARSSDERRLQAGVTRPLAAAPAARASAGGAQNDDDDDDNELPSVEEALGHAPKRARVAMDYGMSSEEEAE